MMNVSELVRRRHLTRIKVCSVDGSREVGARDPHKVPGLVPYMLHLWPVHGEEKVGVSLLDTVHGIQRTIQDRRFYPRNTTSYHQG